MKSNASAAVAAFFLLSACVGGARAYDDEGFAAGPPGTQSAYAPQAAQDGYPPPPARDDGYPPPARDEGYPPPARDEGGAGTSYPAPPRDARPAYGADTGGYARRPAYPGQPETYRQQNQGYPEPGGYGDPAADARGPAGSSRPRAGEERYDRVGYAGAGVPGLGSRLGPEAVAAASRDLAVGSMIEVTSIDTGRTVLAVVTDRGPPRSDLILDLSPGAARLLGAGQGTVPVRVRKVAATGEDQAALNAGRPASGRLDAPQALLTGLRQSLPAQPAGGETYAAAPPRAAPARGGYYVQVAVLSNAANARTLAQSLGGAARAEGNGWHVQLGPFADAASADRARANVAGRGYGDAYVLIQ